MGFNRPLIHKLQEKIESVGDEVSNLCILFNISNVNIKLIPAWVLFLYKILKVKLVKSK